MDSAKIDYNGNGCIPIPYRITFKNGYEYVGGYQSVINGKNEAYFGIRVSKEDNKVNDENNLLDTDEIKQSSKKINHIEDYDVYIEVIFDKPLDIDSKCGSSIEDVE